MAIEWLSIPAGVLSGVGGAVVAAWMQRPAAVAAAEAERERQAARREVVQLGRDLVARYGGSEFKEPWEVWYDPDFARIRGHLSPDVQKVYVKFPPQEQAADREPSAEERLREAEEYHYLRSHEMLSRDLDRLEREWGLI